MRTPMNPGDTYTIRPCWVGRCRVPSAPWDRHVSETQDGVVSVDAETGEVEHYYGPEPPPE